MNLQGPQDPRPSLSVYYNASRLRTDTWSRLKTSARRLGAALEAGYPGDNHREQLDKCLAELAALEDYWAFPGERVVEELKRLLADEDLEGLAELSSRTVRLLTSHSYRASEDPGALASGREQRLAPEGEEQEAPRDARPYFEVLVVDDLEPAEEAALRARLLSHRRPEDEFVYDVVVVPSFEDALIAVLLNYHLQSVVVRYDFPFRSEKRLGFVSRILEGVGHDQAQRLDDTQTDLLLAKAIHAVRPSLDLYLVTDAPVEELAGSLERRYRRVFYRQEDYRELHMSILKGIRARYRTPFFSAVRSYAQKPTGVFHALPISRGKSISKSHWIKDLEEFYGPNLFLAETSATTAGLDSLLQPHGSLKEAQELAARAFGAERSFFVTNGTSTANKIVLQAVLHPGDIVIASRDCHMSHHYAMVLVGAEPIYLDPYPLTPYSIYGAVPLREIKRQLLALRRAGKLDRVRMLLLTNCSFDGIVYHPERIMEEVLAIKPDMIFVWDEAWFAFARFNPLSRRRTAMEAAKRLRERFASPDYQRRWEAWQAAHANDDDDALLEERLLPDPGQARVRVYATQSTHKTLTSLRQGSMILVRDQDFQRQVIAAFHQAYLTHTSTSANYQLLASMDVGRRQVELEGYELVQHQAELAVTLRERVNNHPLISKYFRLLTPEDLIPAEHRPSGFQAYGDLKTDWSKVDEAWAEDEFCLEPSRLTLFCGALGVEGDAFKRRLIEEFDIQINKTSRNTVLFMTHIGSTRGAVAYLIEVLTQVAAEMEDRVRDEGQLAFGLRAAAVSSLTKEQPILPNCSRFHAAFRPDPTGDTPEGDLRGAFFLAGHMENVEYLKLDGSIQAVMASGRQVVAATFIIPYPPGFPLLVPGQVISPEILSYLKALDVKEIHGYEPAHGLCVFREDTLAEALTARSRAGALH
ncbi:MAG: aminotransferase class I/II-fold pyridoxal phosphate-dependent enzyme [Planctomycetota bacterium]